MRLTEREEPAARYAWDAATPGDTLPAHDGWPCGLLGPADLACTRQFEHTGQHVATADRVVLAVWPGDPE